MSKVCVHKTTRINTWLLPAVVFNFIANHPKVGDYASDIEVYHNDTREERIIYIVFDLKEEHQTLLLLHYPNMTMTPFKRDYSMVTSYKGSMDRYVRIEWAL